MSEEVNDELLDETDEPDIDEEVVFDDNSETSEVCSGDKGEVADVTKSEEKKLVEEETAIKEKNDSVEENEENSKDDNVKEAEEIIDNSKEVVKEETTSVESNKEEEMQSESDSIQNDEIPVTAEDDVTNSEKETGVILDTEGKNNIIEENNTSETEKVEDDKSSEKPSHDFIQNNSTPQSEEFSETLEKYVKSSNSEPESDEEVVEPVPRNSKKIGLIVSIGIVAIVAIIILCLVCK